ncbi:MAG: hypothetical protein AAGM21_14515 [Pseudomonadota bacterium]
MKLPKLYYRIRDNGALVFRVDAENRQGRLDLDPLAMANVRNGEVRPQGGRNITAAERRDIEAWIAARQSELADRDAKIAPATVEAINAAAHWVQTKASAADIDAHANAMLMAMHDLRSQIVRRQADALDTNDD